MTTNQPLAITLRAQGATSHDGARVATPMAEHVPTARNERTEETNHVNYHRPTHTTRVTRSAKGRSSFILSGPREQWTATVGLDAYVDPILDTVVRVNGRSESALIAAANAFVTVATRGHDKLDRLIGSTVTRPETIAGDRATIGATTVDDDDDYIPHVRLVADQYPKGKRTETTYRYACDEPTPRPVTIGRCLVRSDEMAEYFGINADEYRNELALEATDTSMSWNARARITADNRLHTDDQLARASLSLLGVARVPDEYGEGIRDVRIIGRRNVDEQGNALPIEVVGFTDDGYFLGHQYVKGNVRKPAAARVARLAERIAERDIARAALRAQTMSESEPTGRPGASTLETSDASEAVTNSPLQTIRAMALGQTIAGLTRTHASRWTDGATTYSSHATAAIALGKLSATI